MIVVVKFASNEMPWALRTCTIYGRIANIAVNCISMNRIETRANGLSVRFFVMSLNLSTRVGGGWVHFALDFTQLSHEADIWLISLSWLNSVETLSVDTHPRSTCNVFCASSERFFESSQIGASGTWKEEIEGFVSEIESDWVNSRNAEQRQKTSETKRSVYCSNLSTPVRCGLFVMIIIIRGELTKMATKMLAMGIAAQT